MTSIRHLGASLALVAALWLGAFGNAAAQSADAGPRDVLLSWYSLVLELVRHTPTYSPPVASRTFGYLGVTAYESVASGSADLQSLAGQLNGLEPVPPREAGLVYSDAVVLQAAMAMAVQSFFGNTGPTGKRVMAARDAKLSEAVAVGLPEDVVARSVAHGRAVAAHVVDWSRDDGGAVIENMGFPLEYTLTAGAARWVPTSLVRQQQAPLLPEWGKNRTMAMPDGAACPLPPPPDYSEDAGSAFYLEALEVIQVKRDLTPEQIAIARFWSDDAMLTPTPPGHWVSIALQILQRDDADLEFSVDVLARLGVAVSDAFVGCWNAKFEYDLLRPVTYIRRLIEPKWEPLLATPPFPEYPSGHSTQSGAAAAVLTDLFGENFAFDDATHEDDGIEPRHFPSFWAAADEAAVSRLYGGIHFATAIERGLDQGRCIAGHVIALATRRK